MAPWLYNPVNLCLLNMRHIGLAYQSSVLVFLNYESTSSGPSVQLHAIVQTRHDDMLLRPVFKGIALSSDCGEADFFSE